VASADSVHRNVPKRPVRSRRFHLDSLNALQYSQTIPLAARATSARERMNSRLATVAGGKPRAHWG
jgi:hypothetical protein